LSVAVAAAVVERMLRENFLHSGCDLLSPTHRICRVGVWCSAVHEGRRVTCRSPARQRCTTSARCRGTPRVRTDPSATTAAAVVVPMRSGVAVRAGIRWRGRRRRMTVCRRCSGAVLVAMRRRPDPARSSPGLSG
jgi:hypothetical protein